jgi:hypothetical protein
MRKAIIAAVIAIAAVATLGAISHDGNSGATANSSACTLAQQSFPGVALTADQLPGLQRAFNMATDSLLQTTINNLIVDVQSTFSTNNEITIAENNIVQRCDQL